MNATLPLYAAMLASTAGFDEIPLGERRPLAMLVITPGASRVAAGSDLFRAADEVLNQRTGLTIEAPEKAGIDLGAIAACPASELLACYSGAVPESSGRVRRTHLFVLTLFDRAGGKTGASALLIDLDAARRARESIFGNDDESRQRLEDAIFERTARAVERTVELGDAASVKAYFQQLFDRELRPMLDASGDYDPYGSIELGVVESGLEIEVDDLLIGRTGGKPVLLKEVRPRTVRIELRDSLGRFLPYAREVLVERGARAKVDVELVRVADPGVAGDLRDLSFWTGIGFAAAGAVLTSYALVASPSAERVEPCAQGSCTDPGPGFATFCELSQERPSACNGSGVLAAPLGYSMILTGGVWSLGTKLYGDDDELPWVQWVAGLVLGTAAYTISAVAN